MSITEELRKWMRKYYYVLVDDMSEFYFIANRIDKEYEECKGFCERLEEAAVDREDATLFGVDYTPLPKDANGVPVHIGDVMEWPDGKTFEVIGIGGGMTLLYVIEDGVVEWTQAHDKRHHHEPAIVNVLQEMLEKAVGYSDAHTTVAFNTITEYASKLQLKEVAE